MELYSMGPSVPGCLDPLIVSQEGASLTLERRLKSQHRCWMEGSCTHSKHVVFTKLDCVVVIVKAGKWTHIVLCVWGER